MNKNTASSAPTNRYGVDESIRLVHRHLDPIVTAPVISSANVRISSPTDLTARAGIRRIDDDNGPKRIEGTDTYNHPVQHNYQNVRQLYDEPSPKTDPSNESRKSFSAKRDFFEQHMKPTPTTYDSPPRQTPPTRKIITTITTTTANPPSNSPETRRSSSNDSPPSIDRLLEQAADLQKSTRKESVTTKDDSLQPIFVERSEQFQVFLDSANQEVRRTPSVSRVSLIPSPKTTSETDLNRPQLQADRLIDDHQAIQQLTRALQQHNASTVNEFKRLPSQTNSILVKTTTTTTSTVPSHIVSSPQAKPAPEELTVIDALLANPLGTTDEKQNATLRTRLNKIISNLQNSEYVNLLKRSKAKATATRPKKEKAKKKKKTSENTTYEVITAIVNSPICPRMPNMSFVKYPPISALSSSPPNTANPGNNTSFFQSLDDKKKNETSLDLAGVVHQMTSHHATTPTAAAPVTSATANLPASSSRSTVRPEVVQQQQQLITPSNQSQSLPPRVIYRYLDEQGRVLKISSVSPSELQETVPQQQSTVSKHESYSTTAATQPFNQTRARDEERPRPLSEGTGRATRQGPSTSSGKGGTEIQQQSQTLRAIPVSIVPEHSTRAASQHTSFDWPSKQPSVKPAWLPLGKSPDSYYTSHSTAGYDTDSTISEPSAIYRPYDYAPKSSSHRYLDRGLASRDHYYHHGSPDVPYHYSSPTLPPGRLPEGSRRISPDYGAGPSRNYIEIFRDGATKPSEIYSLPLNELLTSDGRHSRYDHYQTERSRKHRSPHHQHSKSSSRYENMVPSLHSQENHSMYPHTVGNSPNRDSIHFDDYLRPSKSVDYRPLRSKLQREYKLTPSLLLDEWEQASPPSVRKTYEQQTSVSSPDDVFIKNPRPNKARPWNLSFATDRRKSFFSWMRRSPLSSSSPVYMIAFCYRDVAISTHYFSLRSNEIKRKMFSLCILTGFSRVMRDTHQARSFY